MGNNHTGGVYQKDKEEKKAINMLEEDGMNNNLTSRVHDKEEGSMNVLEEDGFTDHPQESYEEEGRTEEPTYHNNNDEDNEDDAATPISLLSGGNPKKSTNHKHRVILKIKGQFVDIMCQVNEEYKKDVMFENGTKVLYLKVICAIYGCIRSALLWYNLYSSTLQKEGYVINPYDKCVANKSINGTMCTIVWYVDDNKVSHIDEKVVTDKINKISEYFGELTITRGNQFQFLGMDIEIDRKRKVVKLSMIDQIKEAIEMVGKEIKDNITCPAYRDLFESYKGKSPVLSKEKSEKFHSIVAKLLFITKRTQPDIETAISYLTTRVSKSNEHDWFKMKRVLSFLKYTLNDKRIIGASSLHDLYTWIDAAYAVHDNM